MRAAPFAVFFFGFWAAVPFALAQQPATTNLPAHPVPASSQPASPPPKPAAEPGEVSHEDMVKEQERRDREEQAERDRDDQG